MVTKDPAWVRWAAEQREARQAKNIHRAFTFGIGTGEPTPGAGGIEVHSSDNENGARDLDIALRPVLLGLVEWRVQITTRGVSATRPHSKSTYLYTTPAALREFAAQLLETADEADKARPRPRPLK